MDLQKLNKKAMQKGLKILIQSFEVSNWESEFM